MPSTASIQAPLASAAEQRMQDLLARQQQAFRADMNPSREVRLERLARLHRLLDADAEREFAEQLDRLRKARDREEFDRFMAERNARQSQNNGTTNV